MPKEKFEKFDSYTHRPEHTYPPDYLLTNERVIDALHEDLGRKDFIDEGVTDDTRSKWTEILAKGRLPEGYETAKEFEDYIIGIIGEE